MLVSVLSVFCLFSICFMSIWSFNHFVHIHQRPKLGIEGACCNIFKPFLCFKLLIMSIIFDMCLFLLHKLVFTFLICFDLPFVMSGLFIFSKTFHAVMYFYLYSSDELRLFQIIFIVRSCVVLLYRCPRLGKGWDQSYIFNPATLCIYMPVPSQEPLFQWLSFVDVIHICFCSFLFVQIKGR